MSRIIEILKARFLVSDGAVKNWRLIIYIFLLAFIMIITSHSADEKAYHISVLNEEVQVLKSKFVNARSELQEMKLKSTLVKRLRNRGVGFPIKSLKRIVVKIED